MIAPLTLAAVRERRDEILAVAARYGVDDIRLFGSVVKGVSGPSSDLDMLVRYPDGTSLLDHVAFGQDLEDLLGRPVDVVSEPALHWFVRERILSEAVPL